MPLNLFIVAALILIITAMIGQKLPQTARNVLYAVAITLAIPFCLIALFTIVLLFVLVTIAVSIV